MPSPATITVDRGDTIRWTNLDSAPHSAVTVQSGFVTAVLSQNQSTTTTFERPGTFEYICGVHGASMRGTVVVRGTPVAEPPAPPSVTGHVVLDLLVLARFAWVLRHP